MQDMTALFQKISIKKKLKSFKTRGEANEERLQLWEFALTAKS